MKTEPHISNLEELAEFLDEQEKIGKILGNEMNPMEMDNFIVNEVLREKSSEMDVQVKIVTDPAKQSNQVCSFSILKLLNLFPK